MVLRRLFRPSSVPWGIRCFRLLKCFGPRTREARLNSYRVLVLVLTFLSYTFYHMSRKPISVVKQELVHCKDSSHHKRTLLDGDEFITLVDSGLVPNLTHPPENPLFGLDFDVRSGGSGNETCSSFFDLLDGQPKNVVDRYLGFLDTSYLFSYAIFMFVSGIVAERVNLRYYISIGMVLSGVLTILFGMGKYWDIHSYWYYIGVQAVGGAFQATGWPGVVTVVANWFGKGKKGLIFGVWNSHTSIGNIVGGLLAGYFAKDNWGMSFVAPGIIIAGFGLVIWLLLPGEPEDVGVTLPDEDEDPPPDSNPATASSTQYSTLAPGLELLDNSSSSSSHLQPAFGMARSRGRNQNLFGRGLADGAAISSADDIIESGETTPLLSPDNGPEDDSEAYRQQQEVIASSGDGNHQVQHHHEDHAVGFFRALLIPGVLEFSLCLFFAKLVSYTFLYWLPTFIIKEGLNVQVDDAAYLSTLFDVGGIVGGILAGLAKDYSGKSASICSVMLIAALPALYGYKEFCHLCPLDVTDKSSSCYIGNVGLLLLSGLLVNGPYAMITTAVSAELGSHPSLLGSNKAMATVTAIIDGTGSIGAAVGPFLAGALQGSGGGDESSLSNVFNMLLISDGFALALLFSFLIGDIRRFVDERSRRASIPGSVLRWPEPSNPEAN